MSDFFYIICEVIKIKILDSPVLFCDFPLFKMNNEDEEEEEENTSMKIL